MNSPLFQRFYYNIKRAEAAATETRNLFRARYSKKFGLSLTTSNFASYRFKYNVVFHLPFGA